jgi:site-specific DNA recombinase
MPESRGSALIYCRVSTRKQEENGASLDTQERACRDHAEAQGYVVGPIFRDVYSGAELFDRPQLNAMRTEARTRAHEAVIVYAIDRLTRAQGLTAYLVSEFERSGVELLSVTDPLEATREGKLILGIKEYVAEVEREKIRERSLRGKRGRLQAGKLHRSGTDLYGYRRDAEGTRRDIYEPEAAIVREIFQAVTVEGLSARAMWRRLNDRGVSPPSAGKRTYSGAYQSATPAWGFTTVKRIIHESAYKGETVLWRHQRDARTQKVVKRPEESHIRLPAGTTPPIVPADTWDAAQGVLANNTAAKSRNEARPSLLRGLIRCAVCGETMMPDSEHGRRVYRCSSRNKASGPCAGKRATAEATVPLSKAPRDALGRVLPIDDVTRAGLATVPGVEDWVWSRVSAILRDPSLVQAELERQEKQGPDPALAEERVNVSRRLAGVEKQQKRLIQRFGESTDEVFPWELVQEQISRMEREKATLVAMATELDRRLAEQRIAADQLEALTVYIERVAANLEAFGFAEKRLALEALGVKVHASGRDWRIECNIPISADTGVTDTTY